MRVFPKSKSDRKEGEEPSPSGRVLFRVILGDERLLRLELRVRIRDRADGTTF